MHTPKGEVRAGDVLWSRGDAFIVQVQELLEAVLRNGNEIFAVHGSVHEEVREGVFDSNGSACFMEFLEDTAPCLRVGLSILSYETIKHIPLQAAVPYTMLSDGCVQVYRGSNCKV